jgi:hypothetical protein
VVSAVGVAGVRMGVVSVLGIGGRRRRRRRVSSSGVVHRDGPKGCGRAPVRVRPGPVQTGKLARTHHPVPYLNKCRLHFLRNKFDQFYIKNINIYDK